MIIEKTKELYSLQTGQQAAERVVRLLEHACQRIEIAGSVRRKRAQVHDVDLVIWPHASMHAPQQASLFSMGDALPIYYPSYLFDLCRQLGWGNWELGNWPGIIRIPTAETAVTAIERIPIEIYVCEPDGYNFEALLQMRTGSAEYNIRLARRAQELGLRYKAGYGIFEGERRVDDGTERGIWMALGWEYVPPELRG